MMAPAEPQVSAMKNQLAFVVGIAAMASVASQASAQRPPAPQPPPVIIVQPPYQQPLPERQYVPPPPSLGTPMPQAPSLPPMTPRVGN
jgi:hypothetical protein